MENRTVILVSVPPDRFHPEHREMLALSAQGREIVYSTDRAEIEKTLDRVEICIGFGPWDLLSKMPRLAWFQSWSAGVDGYIENPGLKEKPVIITNTTGMHKEQLTEHISCPGAADFPRSLRTRKNTNGASSLTLTRR